MKTGLFDWIRLCTKECKPKMIKSTNNSDPGQHEFELDASETNSSKSDMMDTDEDTADDELKQDNYSYSTDGSSDNDSGTILDENLESEKFLKYTNEGLPFLP